MLKKQKIILSVPIALPKIIKIIESSGFEAFIVGGCVRDTLLNLTPKDWDITTNATPSEIKEIFKENKQFSIFDIGEKHGTLGLFDKKTRIMFEVTTYRVDGEYENFRRPSSVSFSGDLLSDLKRRDFTINALACKILD